MTRERLFLFDTTLRDGAQTQGVDFSVEDKRQIALALDALGIDYIEGGWPGANPTDTAFFSEQPRSQHARLTAFGMTKRAGRSAANDPGLAQHVRCESRCRLPRRQDLGFPGRCRARNSARRECRRHRAIDRGGESQRPRAAVRRRTFLRRLQGQSRLMRSNACGPRTTPARAGWCCATPMAARCRKMSIASSAAVKAALPQAALGIHAHNDTEQAVAVTLAAVRGGARQIQGTLNGLGERCGNANLCALIPTLLLKEPYASQFETGISREELETHHPRRRACSTKSSIARPTAMRPMSGRRPSRTRAGCIPRPCRKTRAPTSMCRRKASATSAAFSSPIRPGQSSLLVRLSEAGIDIDARDGRLARLLEDVKQREFLGYAYDGAEASFELLARRALGQVPEYFDVESFRVMVERRNNALGELDHGLRSRGESESGRRDVPQRRHRQRPGQRARQRAAQRPRQIFAASCRTCASSIIRCASSPAAPRP